MVENETPNKFIDYVKFTSAVLRLKESDENDILMDKFSGKIIKKKKTAYRYYFNFVLNFIPSDIYYFKIEKQLIK